MTAVYEGFALTFPDPADWNLVSVLRRRAAETPDAVYLDAPDEGRCWTYAESLGFAERIARSFQHAGAQPGDRVVVMAANSSAFVQTWFGTTFAGLVEVPLNTAYERDFLAHQVRISAPRWAVIDDTYVERFLQIFDDCSTVDRFWIIDTGQAEQARKLLTDAGLHAVGWEELEAEHTGTLPDIQAHQLASIFFTSGTTGPSKGVAMPHAQMYFFAQECVNLTKLTPQDAYLTVTPLFHGNAQFLAAYPALVAGARFVLRQRFSASRWIDQVRESGVTVTNFVGVMMDFVWKQPPRPNDADNSVRCIYAAPTAWSVLDEFKKRFGIEAFVDAFGLTETSMPFMTPYGVPRPAGAVGLQVADWLEAKLVDPETDVEVPVGQVGELVVRPVRPWTVSMGYYGMPERTVEAWRNLWFHTGDALRRDEAGWFYFVDRYKDALRRRGENISSYEVEQAILGHESIVECAVIGVPADVEAGEDEVLACIVSAGDIDPRDVWQWCRSRLPSFAIPRYLRFVTELPKSQSQKIQKSELRKQGITADTVDLRDHP